MPEYGVWIELLIFDGNWILREKYVGAESFSKFQLLGKKFIENTTRIKIRVLGKHFWAPKAPNFFPNLSYSEKKAKTCLGFFLECSGKIYFRLELLFPRNILLVYPRFVQPCPNGVLGLDLHLTFWYSFFPTLLLTQKRSGPHSLDK